VKYYRIKWPDGEIEVVMAEDETDLFWILDRKGNPFSAVIEEIEPPEKIRISEESWEKVKEEILHKPKIIKKITEEDLEKVFRLFYSVPTFA